VAALVALLALLVAAGCGERGDSVEPSAAPVPSAGPTASPPSGTAALGPAEEEDMRVQITIGEQRFTATLFDSAAARGLLAQLPVAIEMRDHGSVEKTGRLPQPLSLAGQPDGADPDVGDLGYYAPGQDLVLYYGDQSYFPGIVVLGRLEGDAARLIADLVGSVTATVDDLSSWLGEAAFVPLGRSPNAGQPASASLPPS
jgi:hypothetical protein